VDFANPYELNKKGFRKTQITVLRLHFLKADILLTMQKQDIRKISGNNGSL
jgi:hypothetical protein